MAGVMIGIDPHKGSHTAYALDEQEQRVGQIRVCASSKQVEVLLDWAGDWPQRTWAVEGARGLGQLLSQQLVGMGERVLDVPPKLAARVRLLNSGQINKNDPNDARSVAVAALRARELSELTTEDRTEVMRVWSRRFHDLGRLRTQLLCRLHAVLCELVPGGFAKKLTVAHAEAILDRVVAQSPTTQAKLDLARELITDLQRIDAQRRDARRRTARAVTASGSTIRQHHHRHPRCRSGHRRRRARLRPRHSPLRRPRPLRFLQRHRTDRGLLGQPEGLPTLPPRKPATQPRPPHGRGLPDPLPRHRGPHLLRQEDRRRHDRQERAPRPETQDQRRPLHAHAQRRATANTQGPGRAIGERLFIQRGQLTPRNASSSDKPLPGRQQA